MQALHALFLACYISALSSDSRTLGCARLCSAVLRGNWGTLSLKCGTEEFPAAFLPDLAGGTLQEFFHHLPEQGFLCLPAP